MNRFVHFICVGVVGVGPMLAQLSLTGSGSAFIVTRRGHAVTNAHVVSSCDELRVSLGDDTHRATVKVLDASNDLALLLLDPPVTRNVLPFRNELIRIGQNVLALGFPLANELASSGTATSGTVSALAGRSDDSRHFQFSAPIQPGNSGGPIIDTSGRVVGVATMSWIKSTDHPQNVNFAVRDSLVRALLDAKDIEYEIAGVELAPSAMALVERARKAVALVRCFKRESENRTFVSASDPSFRGTETLRDAVSIAVGSFGASDAALLLREGVVNRLLGSGNPLLLVTDVGEADMIMTGVIGIDVAGRPQAALRAIGRGGRILWAFEGPDGATNAGMIAAGAIESLAKAVARAR